MPLGDNRHHLSAAPLCLEFAADMFLGPNFSTYKAPEGKNEESQAPSDLGLIGILYPQATRYTFVPVGGKGNVIQVVPALRGQLREEHYGIKVFGIVDQDRHGVAVDGVVAWPVASIENLLLLDLDAIAVCATRLLKRSVPADDIKAHLLEVAKQLREEEVKLRVMDSIGTRTARIKGASTDEVSSQLSKEREALGLEEARISEIVVAASAEVDAALADGTYIRRFRGKEVLRGLYRRLNLAEVQVSHAQFVYALARVCAEGGPARSELEEVFASFQ